MDTTESGYSVEIFSGGTWSEAERDAAYALIISRGRVPGTQVLRDNLEAAMRLALVHEGNIVIAAGAIKVPKTSYRKRVTDHSKFDVREFNAELGYIAVHPDFEHRGIGRAICNALLIRLAEPVFATTNNPDMRGMLERRGFIQVGDSWKSTNSYFSEPIRLYVRK